MEAAVSKEKAAYMNNHSIKDVKKFFTRSNFVISKIQKIEHLSTKKVLRNEVDIFFKNKNFKKIEKINTNYNERYFARLVRNETYLKDDIFDFFIKIKNLILN